MQNTKEFLATMLAQIKQHTGPTGYSELATIPWVKAPEIFDDGR